MAIDPKHAEATADAKPDTAQDDAEANLESNVEAVTGWTFAEIGRRYNAADDIADVPVEFWVSLGMYQFCDIKLQMARLICHAHNLNLFSMKGKPDDKEGREALAKAMGTTTDTLFGIVDQAINIWSETEQQIDTALHGEYAHTSGEDDLDLPFDGEKPSALGGADLDVDVTIKAVDETLDKEEAGEIDG
jgi:hypothetical protein